MARNGLSMPGRPTDGALKSELETMTHARMHILNFNFNSPVLRKIRKFRFGRGHRGSGASRGGDHGVLPTPDIVPTRTRGGGVIGNFLADEKSFQSTYS